MTCRTAVANDNNLVSQLQFWEAKVNKMIQNFEYGRITMEELVNELAFMGYEKEQVWALIAEDEDY